MLLLRWKIGVNESKIFSLRAQMELEKVLELYIDTEKHDKSIGIGFEAFQTLLWSLEIQHFFYYKVVQERVVTW